MEWQPIETAPKDGTPVMLWPGAPIWTDEVFPCVGWMTSVGLWICARGYVSPTHWKPLPEPPA